MIDIVFFDAGDTILHAHPSFPELFSEVCRSRGRDVSGEQVAEVQTKLAPHLVDLAEETGVENPSFSAEDSRRFWGYLYRRFLSELGIEDEALADALYERFSDRSTYMLFEDVLPVLGELHDRGYRLGLISNFEGWLEERLAELEVGHLFDVTIISGFVLVEKPDPQIYRLALERAEVEAERTVHVGDSMSLDIEPASSVGMNAVLLDRAVRYPESNVPRIVSLEELPPLIENL